MPTAVNPTKERLRALLSDLMLIPGLSGYEGRVRQRLARELAAMALQRDQTGWAISLRPLPATARRPA